MNQVFPALITLLILFCCCFYFMRIWGRGREWEIFKWVKIVVYGVALAPYWVVLANWERD